MGSEVAFPIEGSNEKKWEANPRRGELHQNTARAFVSRFPVGTLLTAEDFDSWAHESGYMKVPTGITRSSDAWKAHLQRRHELKYRINQAGSHPRMDTPFIIEALGSCQWEVRAPHVAISKTKMFSSLESLTNTKRKRLEYLMQSADWNVLPAHERAFAEALFDDIDMFQSSLNLNVQQLTSKFAKLEGRLRRAVEIGEIKPRNGGIRAIVDSSNEGNTHHE